MKHGWLQNPRTKWRFIAWNIIERNGGFSSKRCLITRGYTSPNKSFVCYLAHLGTCSWAKKHMTLFLFASMLRETVSSTGWPCPSFRSKVTRCQDFASAKPKRSMQQYAGGPSQGSESSDWLYIIYIIYIYNIYIGYSWLFKAPCIPVCGHLLSTSAFHLPLPSLVLILLDCKHATEKNRTFPQRGRWP